MVWGQEEDWEKAAFISQDNVLMVISVNVKKKNSF